MFGGSRLDLSSALPLKLLVIYCLKVRYLVPLIQKRRTKIKIKNLLINYDMFVRCVCSQRSRALPPSPVLRQNKIAER